MVFILRTKSFIEKIFGRLIDMKIIISCSHKHQHWLRHNVPQTNEPSISWKLPPDWNWKQVNLGPLEITHLHMQTQTQTEIWVLFVTYSDVVVQ